MIVYLYFVKIVLVREEYYFKLILDIHNSVMNRKDLK